MRTLRNVFRRKVRAALTIFGITIGVFALVVMGSLSEKLTLLVDGGTTYFADKVIITEGDGFAGFGSNPMTVSRIEEVEAIEGVARASAQIGLLLDEDGGGASFGPPAQIQGDDLRGEGFEDFDIRYAAGRALTVEDEGAVVVGSDLVGKLDAEIGKDITIRGQEFEVVGILEKTLTAPDTTVVLPLIDVQKMFLETLPEIVKAELEAEDLATQLIVYPEAGTDADELAEFIEEEIEGVNATGPKVFEEQIANSVGIFSQIIFGVALISLLVGGLSVVNTMTMSISERTREIGIRKAVGASNGSIIRQFLAESATIGLLGGMAGLALGALFVAATNGAGDEAATELFLLTPRLALGSLAFALTLGVISGFFPSWRAARMDPVKALRYE